MLLFGSIEGNCFPSYDVANENQFSSKEAENLYTKQKTDSLGN
jgi:hypothetical protein